MWESGFGRWSIIGKQTGTLSPNYIMFGTVGLSCSPWGGVFSTPGVTECWRRTMFAVLLNSPSWTVFSDWQKKNVPKLIYEEKF